MESDYLLFFQESVFIGGTPNEPLKVVHVNGCTIEVPNLTTAIGLITASYLCFNLVHPRGQEPVLEAIEGFLGLRRSYKSVAAKNFVKS